MAAMLLLSPHLRSTAVAEVEAQVEFGLTPDVVTPRR